MNKQRIFAVLIKIKKPDLLKIYPVLASVAVIISQDEQEAVLHLPEALLSRIDEKQVPYEIVGYRGVKQLYHFLINKFTIVIGVLLFSGILYLNAQTVQAIRFSTYTADNEKIQAIIEKNLDTVSGMHFLKTNINDVNLTLRKEFSDLEWVSVRKSGCVLYVTVLQPGIINKQIEYVEGFGDLVAKSDGVIQMFKVTHGIPVIEQNQYVKKGQLLVSGNLRINNEGEDPFFIPASGKVYAEVWNTAVITVPKKKTVTEYTGKIYTEKSLVLFGIEIKYKSFPKKYKTYDIETEYQPLKIFNITLPFGIKKIHYLEKNDIIKIYDKDASYDYAYSSIQADAVKRLSKDEKVLKIEKLQMTEDDREYTYTFFVSTYENIAIFQRR